MFLHETIIKLGITKQKKKGCEKERRNQERKGSIGSGCDKRLMRLSMMKYSIYMCTTIKD